MSRGVAMGKGVARGVRPPPCMSREVDTLGVKLLLSKGILELKRGNEVIDLFVNSTTFYATFNNIHKSNHSVIF